MMHWDKDNKDKLVFTIMIGDNPYCSVESEEDSLSHAVIQLMAMYVFFHSLCVVLRFFTNLIHVE